MSLLRPQRAADLPILVVGDSPFDEFGPRTPKAAPTPAALDADGGLTVATATEEVAGQVSWRWQQWDRTRVHDAR